MSDLRKGYNIKIKDIIRPKGISDNIEKYLNLETPQLENNDMEL